MHLAKTGHPEKKNDVLDAVQKLVTDKKKQTPFTDDRPGDLVIAREPESVTGVRAVVTEASIRIWFDTAKSYLSNQEGSTFQEIMADPIIMYRSLLFSSLMATGLICPMDCQTNVPSGR